MKQINIIIVSTLLLVFLFGCKEEEQVEPTKEQRIAMEKVSTDFMKSLKGVLVSEIESNGIVSAVSVCSDTAQVLTNKFGTEKGLFIKRVSFKNRNPANAPDDFETEVLKEFEKMNEEGNLSKEIDYIKIVEEDDVTKLRYLKPIFVEAPCLNCHGMEEQMSTEVLKVIDEYYKNDKARNYNVGDLRGAVSVEKVL